MPPAKRTQLEDAVTLKEKLHSLQGNPRARRNGATNLANLANGSNLKEVMSSTADNASTNSGQNEHTSTSGVSHCQHDPASPTDTGSFCIDILVETRQLHPSRLPPGLPPRRPLC